jgi:hypothetical protein
MHIKLLSIAAAVALAFGTAAQAQQRQDTAQDGKPTASSPAPERNAAKADRKGSNRAARNAEEDRIEAEAKAAKAKCDSMSGQEKDICQQQAKSDEKVKKAELDAKYDPTPRKLRNVEDQRAEAKYEVAKAKCDLQGGKADNACKDKAKAEHDRARAEIKAKYAKGDGKRDRTAGTGATRGDDTPNRDLNRNGK